MNPILPRLEKMHYDLLQRSCGFEDYQITTTPELAYRFALGQRIVLNGRWVPIETRTDVEDFIYMYSQAEHERNEHETTNA